MGHVKPWKVADFGILKGTDQPPWGERFSQGCLRTQTSLLSLVCFFINFWSKGKSRTPTQNLGQQPLSELCYVLNFPSWGEFRRLHTCWWSLCCCWPQMSLQEFGSDFKFRGWKRERQLFGLSTYQTSQGCLQWESVNDYIFLNINNYSIRWRDVKKGLALILLFGANAFL